MLDIISQQELAENGVVSAPDKLVGDPEENKKIFDRLITAVLAPHINRVIEAYNELEAAMRDHLEVDPSSVRDNNVSLTEQVVGALAIEGLNPTVKDALLKLNENNDAKYDELRRLIGEKANCKAGSYVGTGSSGKSAPNSLSFDFVPKLITLMYEDGSIREVGGGYSNTPETGLAFNPQLFGTDYASGAPMWVTNTGNKTMSKRSEDGKTIWWYTTGGSASAQYNSSGTVYHYVAVG